MADKPILINQYFDNFEGFASTAKEWDVDFMQIEKGRFKANLVQYFSNDLQFAQACFNRGLDQHGASPQGVWSFAITVSPEMPLYFKGREISGSNCLMIYPPGSEINAISRSRFGVFTFSAPEHFLEILAVENRLAGFKKRCKKTDILLCRRHDINALRSFFILLLSGLNGVGARITDLNRNLDLANSIPIALLQIICHRGIPVHKQAIRLRDRAFKQTIAYIQAHAQENPSVQSMVLSTGVSKRTLEYAYQERLGISPKQYILMYRLNGVRKILSRATPSLGAVTDVANQWGFWHMGQFAKNYKDLFKELPSDTLKNSRKWQG